MGFTMLYYYNIKSLYFKYLVNCESYFGAKYINVEIKHVPHDRKVPFDLW